MHALNQFFQMFFLFVKSLLPETLKYGKFCSGDRGGFEIHLKRILKKTDRYGNIPVVAKTLFSRDN